MTGHGKHCENSAIRGFFLYIIHAKEITNPMILVAGGPGAWMGLRWSLGGFENGLVAKRIEPPKNWDKLAAKYKNIVPDCGKY